MNNFTKGALVFLLVLYIISPLDLLPGPIDDLIIGLIGFSSLKGNKVETLRNSGHDNLSEG